MKKLLLLLIVPILFSTAMFGQNINGRMSASFYTFDRFDSIGSSKTYLRTFESLTFNINNLVDKVSIKSRINFESNIGNALDNEPRWRVYNLYIEARDLFNVATVKLGRQPFITSVGGGVYDALNMKLKYQQYTLSGFFGANVPAYQRLDVNKYFFDNYILGAKFTATPNDNLFLALSYVDKNVKNEDYSALRMDPNNNPVEVLIQSKSNEFKYLSAEADYDYKSLNVNGRFDYDVNYAKPSKVVLGGRADLFGSLGVTVDYNYLAPRIRYNSIFSVFDFGNTNEIEVGADYKLCEHMTAFAKFGNVSYDDETSQRINVGINSNFGSISYRKNLGYAGEMDAVSLFGAYTLWEGLLTPSVGLSYTTYKLTKDDAQNSITSLLAGVNYHPFKAYSFDLQVQFSNNKIYKNDTRLLFSVSHWFNSNMSSK